MHLPAALIVGFSLIATLVVAAADYLALRIFKLRSSRSNLIKILSVQVVLTVAISLVALLSHISSGLNLLLWLVNIIVWVYLIRRYAADRYKLSRAILSYFLGYVLMSVFSAVVAIVLVGSFIQSYKVDGNSMAPAYKNSDTVLVYKFERHPYIKDVIVYKGSDNKQVLGRVEGLPNHFVNVTEPVAHVGAGGQPLTTYKLNADQYYVTTDQPLYNVPPRVINSSDIIGTVGPKL